MPPAAVPVTLTAAERKTLKKRVRGAKTCWRDRLRAQIVLAAARGRGNARIAADLGTGVDTVRKWRGRFAERGLPGLEDLPGPGGRGGSAKRTGRRRSRWPASCRPRPGCRWTGPELAAELTAQGLVSEPVSTITWLLMAVRGISGHAPPSNPRMVLTPWPSVFSRSGLRQDCSGWAPRTGSWR